MKSAFVLTELKGIAVDSKVAPWWPTLGLLVLVQLIAFFMYFIQPKHQAITWRPSEPLNQSVRATPATPPTKTRNADTRVQDGRVDRGNAAANSGQTLSTANGSQESAKTSPFSQDGGDHNTPPPGGDSPKPPPPDPIAPAAGEALVIVIATPELAMPSVDLVEGLKHTQRNHSKGLVGRTLYLLRKDVKAPQSWVNVEQPPTDRGALFDSDPSATVLAQAIAAAEMLRQQSKSEPAIPVAIVWPNSRNFASENWKGSAPPATRARVFVFWSGPYANGDNVGPLGDWLGSEQQIVTWANNANYTETLGNYLKTWLTP